MQGLGTNVSSRARSFFLIAILSAVAISVVSTYLWPQFLEILDLDGGATVTGVFSEQEPTFLCNIVSRMGVLGRLASLTLLSWLSGVSSAKSQDSFESDCIALPYRVNETNAPNTSISRSQYIPGGTILDLSEVVNSTCLGTNVAPATQKVSYDVCRVAAYTRTSERSGIHYELWMPLKWSGRFISHGNGRLAGCITAVPLLLSQIMGSQDHRYRL